MPSRLLIHIGSNKCGSSALQTALSEQPLVKGSHGETIAYAAITSDGTLLHGENLRQAALRKPHGYEACPHQKHIVNWSMDQQRHLRRQFHRIEADTVVLSRETWRNYGQIVGEYLLPLFSVPTTAVVYVRPQITYLNAGWWQWAAWEDVTLSDWVDQKLPDIQWHRSVLEFIRTSGIEDVRVRLYPKEIVADFYDVLHAQVDPPTGYRLNSALPPALLRVFQRHRKQLRPGPHKSAIDFVLSRHLARPTTSPWVLDQSTVRHIIDFSYEDNLRLLGLLDPQSAQAMKSDPQWWDFSFYADKTVEPWQAQPPQDKELDELCAQLAQIVLDLEKKNRSRK